MNENPGFVHYAEPWEFAALNRRTVVVGLDEVEKPSVFGELAYLAIADGDAVTSTLLTADELMGGTEPIRFVVGEAS